MYPFSCVLVLRQIARYLPHHRSENASKTHPKSAHDKFKTASEWTSLRNAFNTRFITAFNHDACRQTLMDEDRTRPSRMVRDSSLISMLWFTVSKKRSRNTQYL